MKSVLKLRYCSGSLYLHLIDLNMMTTHDNRTQTSVNSPKTFFLLLHSVSNRGWTLKKLNLYTLLIFTYPTVYRKSTYGIY